MNKGSRILIFLTVLIVYQQDLSGQSKTNGTIDSLLIILKFSREDTNRVNTLNRLVYQHLVLNNLDIAKEYAKSSIQLAGILGFKKGKARGHYLSGLIGIKKGNYDTSILHFRSAIKIDEETDNRAGVAQTLLSLGGAYTSKGNLVDALKCYQSSLKIQEGIGNKRGQMMANNSVATGFGNMGNYPEALKYFKASLKLARELRDNNAIANNINNIANIFIYEGNLTEALKYVNESLEIFRASGRKEGMAFALNMLGVIYEMQEKHDESMHAFLECQKIYEEIGNRRDIAKLHNKIGAICISKENYAEALEHQLTALQIFVEINDKWGIAESNASIAHILSIQGSLLDASAAKAKYDEAINYASKALLLVKEVGARETEKGLYETLWTIYTRMGDYKNALEYKRLYLRLKDSLMSNATTRKLEQLRTQYEVEEAVNKEKASKEKAIEIEKLKYRLALLEKKTEQEKLFAAQKFENERILAEEKAKHQRLLAEEKTEQEIKDAKARALLENEIKEKKRRTDSLIAGMAGFALISVLCIIIIRQRNKKNRAIEKAETAHKITELELQSLRAQLNPHFMFNSLNAIQDLILREENEKSHIYLSRFAKLLRQLLDSANQPFVTIKQEMEFLELYLSLENLRVPNLQFSIVKDPQIDLEMRMIPNMILQPYIENAIWHGLSQKKGEKRLNIRIHEKGAFTEFEVEDNGIGRKMADELKQKFNHVHNSRGMQLLSKRFELLSFEYGDAIKATISDLQHDGKAAGTLVKIEVPISLSKQAQKLAHDQNHNN